MSYKLSKRSYRNLRKVEPILIAILTEAIKESPYDFGIPSSGGYRSAVEQNILYTDGKSKCDGYRKKSYHQTGLAFDIYGYVNGKGNWEADVLTRIARHIQRVAKVSFKVDLEWGGDWKGGWDKPHFQINKD